MASLITALATKPQVLVLFFFLFVPGFLLIMVFDRLHPDERRGTGQKVFGAVFFSFVILAIWFLPALILLQRGGELPYWLYQLLLFALILLGLFATPLLLAYAFHRLELRGTLQRFRPDPSPAPSEWVFSHGAGKHYYVLFHRKEGKDIGGYFGENSFSASSPEGKEIYVEEVWRLDEDGRFIARVEGTGGAIVHKEDCETIEFFETLEAHDGRMQDGGSEPSTNETDPTSKPLER